MTQIPNRRSFSKYWASVGRPDVLNLEVFSIEPGDVLQVQFLSANSPRRQGIWIGTEGKLEVIDQARSFVFWTDTAPESNSVQVIETTGFVTFYNIWEIDNDVKGFRSLMYTSGMLHVEREDGIHEYHCTDTGKESDFDRLVFTVQVIKSGSPS